jgi:molybdopterin-guanine dinucleotide biosynthesis protein A
MLAGIRASKSEDCLVVPGNLPFIKPSIILALFEAARRHDAAIPRWADGRLEPLVAVYRRQSFIKVAERLNSGDVDELVGSFYAIRYIGVEDELRGLDPELLSFFRVRSKDDLSKAEKWVSAKQKT